MKRFSIFLIVGLSFLISLQSQSFQIRNYGIKDGMIHESTYALIQDDRGFIWTGTSLGLCRFDGISFSTRFIGDTLSRAIAGTAYSDSKGRLWFGHFDGTISMFNGLRFKVFKPFAEANSSVIGFVEDKQGAILAMTQQHGIVKFSPSLEMSYLSEPFMGTFISEFYLTDDENLLVGGFVGLSVYTYNADSLKYIEGGRISGIPFTRIQKISPGLEEGTYWIGTEDEGLYFLRGKGPKSGSYIAKKVGEEQGLEYSSITSVLVDDRGYIWVSDYGKGVYRFNLSKENKLSNGLLLTVEGGLQEEYIKSIFKDDEGNIWFGSQSKGISVLRDQAFTFFDYMDGFDVPQISSLSLVGANNYFGSKKGIIVKAGLSRDDIKYYSPANGLPSELITALWQASNGDLYIGTESSGVFRKKSNEESIARYFYANNSLGNSINALDGDSEVLWVASNNGVYKIELNSGEVLEHKSTTSGLPHNLINDVLVDSEGRVWIATRTNGLFCLTDDKDIGVEGFAKLELVSLAEDDQGRIWAATKEDGVIKFDKDSLVVFSLENGLLSKYTYAVGIDLHGMVWVGHRLGLSKIDPVSMSISVFDPKMGFTSDISHNAIGLGVLGTMAFGTSDGLIEYNPSMALKDTVPPRLNITELNISDSIYNVSKEIKLPYGVYKMRIDYVGINMSNPDQVSYRYKLDGFDDWSEPTKDKYAKYSRIEDGNYTFMLQACDGQGNCTGEIEMIKVSVKIPIWKAWWFILSLFVLIISGVFFYIKRRERKQKALQEYLETQLDERTREVIHQKEEIEVKNRDITDSINYAQRIQASILPPIQRLHHTFSGSFVFYQPRDIVSGDFYWYDKLDEDRFMIVCADSTGHGVPGAFMSMIGTTLIKDICLRDGVDTPSDVLKTLDNEVREALNQNVETDGSNDGMDIIVAEINMKTNKFIVSSAMRPVILYKDGEQIYVKGSRSSVGGQLDEENMNKEFTNEIFDLKKGDIVYMFSDGYPDQFGGPLGRKFKMVRLKNLLRDIHEKPMDEQYNYIKSNFFLWKEDLEQVDDVLFMGVKI